MSQENGTANTENLELNQYDRGCLVEIQLTIGRSTPQQDTDGEEWMDHRNTKSAGGRIMGHNRLSWQGVGKKHNQAEGIIKGLILQAVIVTTHLCFLLYNDNSLENPLIAFKVQCICQKT